MPMKIEYDVPITMDDGVVLRADVFRPDDIGSYAVIMSYGPYGKGLSFQEAFKSAWERMIASFPEVAEGTSNRYQVWELVDPEKWVPDDVNISVGFHAELVVRKAGSTFGLARSPRYLWVRRMGGDTELE